MTAPIFAGRHKRVEVKCRTHAYRRETGCSVESGSNSMHGCKIGDAPHVSDAASVDDRHPNEIDQACLDEKLAIPDGIETSPAANGVTE